MPTPTEETYTEWQQAYDFFNTELFGGQLPPCLITLQRRNHTYGYFCGNRWTNHTGTIRDEIALNPVHFVTRSTAEVLSTLVHEMVHLWQHHKGKPSRHGYHNLEWSTKMQLVGLIPSDTGEPGGKYTGQHMSHYIFEDGLFASACERLLQSGFLLSWHDRAHTESLTNGGKGPQGAVGKTNRARTKYTCPACGVNVWGKPQITVLCGPCQMAFRAAERLQGAV